MEWELKPWMRMERNENGKKWEWNVILNKRKSSDENGMWVLMSGFKSRWKRDSSHESWWMIQVSMKMNGRTEWKDWSSEWVKGLIDWLNEWVEGKDWVSDSKTFDWKHVSN